MFAIAPAVTTYPTPRFVRFVLISLVMLLPLCSGNVKEVMAIENTMQFKGLYHVLGGIISPIDGIGPSDIEIGSLVERVKQGTVKEVILALSATMEGDTTNFYIYRKLQPFDVKVSIIARGVSVGDEIEYADEVTLGRSIINRTPFDESYKNVSTQ